MDRLDDKVAIITGAADGIGLAISKVFASEGASVVMADISEDKCKREADKLKQQGFATLALKCDVGDSESVNALIARSVKTYGKIDVLVNNASVAMSGNITEMPDEDWDTLMNINLKGYFRCIKASLPYMVEAKGGSIINMSSTQAHRSWDNWTAYAAAKGAIMSMTTQLAGQFGKNNIRFNSISPGTILTPMAEDRIENEGGGFLEASKNQSAMLRFGDAKEVAMTALLLASDEARFITGEDIKIDGGLCSLPRYIEL